MKRFLLGLAALLALGLGIADGERQPRRAR